MGSRKTIFSLSIKHVAALASVLGAIGGVAVATASAQTAQFEPLNQAVRQASNGQDFVLDPRLLPQENVARLASNTVSPRQVQNSARIIRSQPVFVPPVRQQATANRRALVGRGRMVSAGFRQEPGVLGGLPPQPSRTVLQRQDEQQGFFGEDQPVPTIPRNDNSPIPAPQTPQPKRLQDGELPAELFQNPFDKERRPEPDKRSVEIPGQLLPEPPRDTPRNDKEMPRNDEEMPRNDEKEPRNSTQKQAPNPFLPDKKQNVDNPINYQSGRGFNTTRSRSNVYRAPGSDKTSQPENNNSNQGVYFVPAYDPIPGTHQSTLAPPTTIAPGYHPWQQPALANQHAPPPPQYQHPQYQHPQYQHPQYQPPQYQQPQYQHPQYQLPPTPHAHPQHFAPTPALNPQQQVYSPVVQPPANLALGRKGPMTPIRRGLLGKIHQDLKRDWGFGDYQSCLDAGNCGGCSTDCGASCGSSCDTKCPVFYIGFQAAWNDAFDVANDQGSELQLDDGSAFFFSLGRMNGRNLRTEIELSFRSNDIGSLVTPDAELAATGQLQTFSGMANLYWEFVDFPTGRLKPYFGGGVGFLSVSSDLRLTSDPSSLDDSTASTSSFAYQWMAGVNYKVSNHLDLYGEYRFVDAESFGISSDRDDLSGNFGYSANSVGGGLRWKF